MRNTVLGLLLGAALTGCISDRSLTGPLAKSDPTALLVRSQQVVSRCAQPVGPQYEPYYVVNGRVFAPGQTSIVARLNPADITAIGVLKGEAAAARYGSVAGIVGVVVITTRTDRGASARSAP
jgi:hypothetical protein